MDELEESLRSRRSSEEVLLAESGAAAVTVERVRWSVDYIALCEMEMLTLPFLVLQRIAREGKFQFAPQPDRPDLDSETVDDDVGSSSILTSLRRTRFLLTPV